MILSRKVGDTLRDGLVLDLPLSEKDGDTFMSDDVYGHLCTNYGSDWNIQGHTFNGTSDYVDCGNDESLDINIITISMWIKWYKTAEANNRIITNTDDWFFFVSKSGGNYYLRAYISGLSTNDIFDDTSPLIEGEWAFVSVVYNGSKIILYKDGYQIKVVDATGNIQTSSNNVLLGWDNTFTDFFNGSIDEVHIYNHALAEDEIELLYNQSKGKYL